jgi:hypothetical protein
MSDTIEVKTKTCGVCNNFDVLTLNRIAIERWQAGELIQDTFPDMSLGDRELLISGIHPACWDKLFPKEDEDE